VLAVVLTGYLDDDTVVLQAIKKRGEAAIVQDPGEAEYPAMPRSALRYVQVDHCAPAGTDTFSVDGFSQSGSN
jgi:two-component system, chemotaxis family, protein-glutamate methylesterase/glutaminase